MSDFDLLQEPEATPGRGLSLGSIVLLAGVALVALVFGVALARQNQAQPTSGAAPDFTITTFDGDQFTLSEQRGKVVVVNFWASWCGPCREEAPVLQAIWERYRDLGVMVVGVAYVDDENDSRAFIAEFGITYPNGPDLGTRISDAYHIAGVPETFIVDQEGNVAQFILAQVTIPQLTAILDDLLADGVLDDSEL